MEQTDTCHEIELIEDFLEKWSVQMPSQTDVSFIIEQNDPAYPQVTLSSTRKGYQLFLIELLSRYQEMLTDPEKTFIHFDEEFPFHKDYFHIDGMEITEEVEPETLPEERGFITPLIGGGCILIVLFILFCTVLGIITLFDF